MKQTMILLAVVGFGLCHRHAQALPEFWNTFKQTYAVRTGTPLDRATCVTCHVTAGPPARNPYGMTIKEALHSAKTRTLTPAMLHQIEAKDSDGDGVSNGDEIAAGTLPGDPKSLPSTKASSGGIEPAPVFSAPTKAPLIPLHSFHPQIVHFPIALFLFGGFLEGWGWWRRRPGLREAGFICMVGASILSFAAVATGFVADYRNGFGFRGVVLTHLILAISATVGMAVTALLGYVAGRSGKERGSWLYWLMLVVSLALVGIAGHYGGMLVYG